MALFYEDDVWCLRPYNDNELVARIYKLKYNTQEEIKSADAAAASAPQAQTGGIGGTSSGGSTPDLGLSLQGVTDVFRTDPKRLIEDIRSLLGIPTSGPSATNTGEVSVDNPNTMPPQSMPPNSQGGGNTNVVGESGGPQAIWNSDSNTLYVVATRQQQQWVEGYLQSMDRPQALIAIEVKFLETNKNPKEQLGVDWAGTLGNGLTLSAREITASPNGSINYSTDDTQNSQTGVPPPGQPNYNYNTGVQNSMVTFGAPYSAVPFRQRSGRDITGLSGRPRQQPGFLSLRVLTRNNREVVIRSVINQPVLASSSSVTPGIGGTTTSSISYLPIGTIINVLPKHMDDGSISLSISISISDILRQENVGGICIRWPAHGFFKAALSVTTGFTVAIGGLEQAKDDTQKNGVPFCGTSCCWAKRSKSTSRSQEKKNLILFITPTLLPPSGTEGIAEKPQSTLPVSPGDISPPAFTPDGRLVGGDAALPAAITWLEKQRAYFKELVREKRFCQEGCRTA